MPDWTYKLVILFSLALFVTSALLSSARARGIVEGNQSFSEITVLPGESIQEAINNATDGDIIIVGSGVHVEESYPIIVNRSVSIIGQDASQTIVDGNDTSVGIFIVRASDATIENLTVSNTIYPASGISLGDVNGTAIAHCIITNCSYGVQLTRSTSCSIEKNNFSGNSFVAIYLHISSSYNTIVGNDIVGNPTGIMMEDGCQNNVVYHNNFVSNSMQTVSLDTNNRWDNGYPSGGNYWSDHVEQDLLNGPDQDLNGSDGILDSSYPDPPYLSLDTYPFSQPIRFFYMWTQNEKDYYSEISSNSTLSGFSFDPNIGNFVGFTATGETGTVGCCRISIPKNLLWTDSPGEWTIRVNETSTIASFLVNEDPDSTYFYFTYNHSAQMIKIIGTHAVPEFSSVLAAVLLLVLCGSGVTSTSKHRQKERPRLMRLRVK